MSFPLPINPENVGIMSALGMIGTPLMAAAHWGKIPDLVRVASAGNYVRAETRAKIIIGGADLTEIRLVYCGYRIVGGQGNEAALGNNQSIQVALEVPGVGTRQFTFSGMPTGVILDGDPEYITDPIYPAAFGLATFAANSSYWVRELRSVTAGQSYARCSATNILTGESTQYSDGLSASQLLNTGNLTTPSGGINGGREFLPAVILGRALGKPDISVLLIGDSLLNGANDTAGGYYMRALLSTGGRAVPVSKMTADGSGMYWFNQGFERRARLFKYFTHPVSNYGSNDGATGVSAANVQIYLRRMWRALKDGGARRVQQVGLLPRTTGNMATVAGQTPIAGFETGGIFRDVVQAQTAADVGKYGLDEQLIITEFQDPTFPDRWPDALSTEGVHPTAAASLLPVATVSARVAQWVYS